MNKKPNTLATTRMEKITKVVVVALLVAVMMAFGMAPSITSAFASTAAIEKVMDVVVDVVGKASLYIGIVICLWGVFQIILAFRREDSEGISKQITTVIVGGVLVTFGATAKSLYSALVQTGNQANGGGGGGNGP